MQPYMGPISKDQERQLAENGTATRKTLPWINYHISGFYPTFYGATGEYQTSPVTICVLIL